MYFWILNSLGKIGWLLSLMHVVCVALRLARFNINTNSDTSWRDNFFEGVPSPAGGILVLSPLIYDVSGLDTLTLNYQFITPIIFILTSILLISKIPTYSLKKIIVPRSSTVFLLFGIILLFGLLLIFTFKALVIGCLIYILAIPASIIHYKKLKKLFANDNKYDEEEPEDVL